MTVHQTHAMSISYCLNLHATDLSSNTFVTRLNSRAHTENTHNMICPEEVLDSSCFLSFVDLFGGGTWLLLMLFIFFFFFCLQKQRIEGTCNSRIVCNCLSWWLPASWNWTHETSVFLLICCLQIAVKVPDKVGVLVPPCLSFNQWLFYEEKLV